MADIKIAMDELFGLEGGYANDPNDKGGETYKGIARKFFPNWKGWQVIDMTPDKKLLDKNQELQNMCVEFYTDNFWTPNRLYNIENQKVANQLFDVFVNFGVKRGVRGIQAILGLKPDSVLGEKTIEAINKADSEVMLLRLSMLLLSYRIYRCSVDASQRKFLMSWVSRDIDYDHQAAKKLFVDVLRWTK